MLRAVLIFFVCLCSKPAHGNALSDLDSLLSIISNASSYQEQVFEGLSNEIGEITDPESMRAMADTLLYFASEYDAHAYATKAYIHKGNADIIQSNYEEALNSFFKALSLADSLHDSRLKGMSEYCIADVYSYSGNSENALKYYNSALETMFESTDSITLAGIYLNAGDEYLNTKNYSKAINYFEKSLGIYQAHKYDEGLAFSYGNLGMAYAATGSKLDAEDYINKAIVILSELNQLYPISVYLNYLADIYIDKNDLKQALKYSQQSLSLAKEHALKTEISAAHLKLSELYELGDYGEQAYLHYKQHVLVRDSIYNVETAEKLANQRTEFEVEQKQVALDLETEKRRSQQIISIATGASALLIGFLAFVLFRNNKVINQTNRVIQAEKDKSEKLLLNILPGETAQELKDKGKVTAKRYENASVLFADFVGFTKYAAQLSPEALVKTIDYYFTRFDEIMDSYGLEKIKTIGDAYMVASGLPSYKKDHTLHLVKAAIDMKNFVQEHIEKEGLQDTLNIRIGLNTGPVVAGVVGSSKFAYDIWGDTVNTASRMESHSISGKINISDTTYQVVKDHFRCTKRQPIEVKSKGFIDMYFVDV